MTRRHAALLCLLASCAPWYRDGEIAGRRATDRKRAHALVVGEARAESKKGNHARAAALVRRAVDEVPDLGADVYMLLATEQQVASDIAGVRATARRGMQLYPSDTRFRSLLVADKVADDLTSEAIDVAGANTLDAALTEPSLLPHLDALAQARKAAHADTAAADLAMWLSHYGVPDHPVLRAVRDEIAARVWDAARSTPSLAALAQAADQADAELAAGRLPRALALYSDVYRLLPEQVLAAHMTGFAKAAQQATDPESLDSGAYALAVAGDRDAAEGLVGLAIRSYRKAVARAPWWLDARRNLAALYDAAGRTKEAAHERAFIERMAK